MLKVNLLVKAEWRCNAHEDSYEADSPWLSCFSKLFHVRPVTQGDVMRADPRDIPRVFQVSQSGEPARPALSRIGITRGCACSLSVSCCCLVFFYHSRIAHYFLNFT